jgi:hypothetical protein
VNKTKSDREVDMISGFWKSVMMGTTLVLLCLPSIAFARGDSGHMGDWSVGGFYGLASVSPGDVNTLSTAVGSSPPLGGISTDNFYGALLEFEVTPRWNLKLEYDWHDAKNNTSTNMGPSTGFEITEENAWGILDFYLVRTKSVYAYIGAGVGTPTYFHLARTTSSNTQFTVSSTTSYEGDAGVGVMLGDHISLFFEGGYQQIQSGNVQDQTGNTLLLPSGFKAQVNLSGPRANAGVKFHF